MCSSNEIHKKRNNLQTKQHLNDNQSHTQSDLIFILLSICLLSLIYWGYGFCLKINNGIRITAKIYLCNYIPSDLTNSNNIIELSNDHNLYRKEHKWNNSLYQLITKMKLYQSIYCQFCQVHRHTQKKRRRNTVTYSHYSKRQINQTKQQNQNEFNNQRHIAHIYIYRYQPIREKEKRGTHMNTSYIHNILNR